MPSLGSIVYDSNRFKQELNGTLMDDEKGIDLSEVPVCVRCGLEVANRTEHETWHLQQMADHSRLQAQIDSLTQSLANILGNVQRKRVEDDMYGHPWISEDEIRKYGWPKAPQGPTGNPYKNPPKFKSGEKYDRHQ